MIIEQQVVEVKKVNAEGRLPKLIKWKGINMVRKHSFNATINDIVSVVEGAGANVGSDAVRIGIVGDTHTGKSTMAEAIAHQVHHKSKLSWIVKKFSKDELVDFAGTLASLNPANHILIFDDVSFLATLYGKHKVDLIQQATTEIRHLEGGRDVKIIAMYNYHYGKALPPYLRQADFKYYTSIGTSELKNIEEMLQTKRGSRGMTTVNEFQRQFTRARIKNYYSINVGQKVNFVYKYRDPFILCLFWDNISIRIIISPTRKWLQPICSICTGTSGDRQSLEQFNELGKAKYGSSWHMAIKQLLLLEGVNTYSPKVVRAFREIDRSREKLVIDLSDLAALNDIEKTKTKIMKPMKV